MKHASNNIFINCERREGRGGSDRGRRSSVQFIKSAIKVIQSVRKISVGSRSVLGRRLVVGYGLQSLPNVLGVVGGQILLKLVTVYGRV